MRAWKRPHLQLARPTTETDSIEQFGVLELLLPVTQSPAGKPFATLNIDRPIEGQILNDTVRFLFSPKSVANYPYTISSNLTGIDGISGSIRAYRPPAWRNKQPDPSLANWWTDDPSPEWDEQGHLGAKTVSRYRRAFLDDFARRMARCSAPAN